MSLMYRLENGEPVACENTREWSQWFETAWPARQLAETKRFRGTEREIRISTVFIGIDHQWEPGGPPLLWETLFFGGGEELDGLCERCSTALEAQFQHERMEQVVDEALARRRRALGAAKAAEGAP